MRKLNGHCVYSPSDLIRFMESEYASWMDRLYLEIPDSVEPDPDSAEDEILRAKGEEHELAFLGQLIETGHDVVNLKSEVGNLDATIRAMRDGGEIIYQGTLASSLFGGIPDFLVRLSGHSQLANYPLSPLSPNLSR